METVNVILDFLKDAVLATLGQLTWLLGLLFIFGLLLYVFARFTRTTYVKTIGPKFDILFTGWIGTPVHELGHALFCIIFGHKINEMKLYTPNSEDGTLGYVNHSYNTSSLYQNVGNFFIGIGPIIFGALVLYAALYYLVPNTTDVFSSINQQSQTLVSGLKGQFAGLYSSLWHSTFNTLKTLFNGSNFSNYLFWIFLYLSICISSHMELSPPDLKGAWSGLLTLVLVLLFFNIVILGFEVSGFNSIFGRGWNYIKLESYSAGINKVVGTSGALLVFANIISGLNFIISYVVLTTIHLIRGKGMVNPMW